MSEELVAPDDDGSAGEVLVAVVPLTPKEEAFVRAYADPESATYGQATKSAEVAQYREPHNAAWKLRRRPRIIARIAEYEKLTRACVGKVLTDLEHERQLALAKGDIAAAIRASELQGKHLAMFTDRLAVDESQVVERYNARRAEEAARITAILLMNPAPLQIPAALAAGQEPQAPQMRQKDGDL
ncbi:MAG: hypothetical protein NTY65_03540 [Planctomycetota bacterium]|nr:hypothetical protein [Planctomycetota bacterium]